MRRYYVIQFVIYFNRNKKVEMIFISIIQPKLNGGTVFSELGGNPKFKLYMVLGFY